MEARDVDQMLMIKEEAPEDHSPCSDLHDPKHIKEEQEDVCISLGGEQLNVKEEDDPTRSATIKSEDDKQSPLLLQIHQDQIKDRELQEEKDGGESILEQDPGDDSISVKTEDSQDYDVKYPVSEIKLWSDYELKTKDADNDWKESRAPESEENINLPLGSSEITEHLVDSCSVHEHMTDSEIETSGYLENNTCLIERENNSSQIHTEVTFSCEDCGKTFISKRTLNKHKKIHTGLKPFSCDHCGQKFTLKGNLNKHMIIHTGQKPFCCDFCGDKFSRKGNLDRHILVHTGQKPFSCDFCGKIFGHKGTLTSHLRIHTGQKPFCCNICGQSFRQTGHLNKHMSIHT